MMAGKPKKPHVSYSSSVSQNRGVQMNSPCKYAAIALFFLHILPARSPAALSDGYVLCGTYGGKSTVLIDRNGDVAYSWQHTTANGYSVYLLENGNLLRTAQVDQGTPYPSGAMPLQGRIEEVDPQDSVVWWYELSNDTMQLHHDMKVLPNGNILACSFILKTIEQMKEVGVDTTLLRYSGFGGGGNSILAETILEIDRNAPAGQERVWEWHLWDHIVPGDLATEHPELFNGSMGSLLTGQWVHLNGLDYCPRRDLIVFTSRLFSEIYIIDHSTTTEEAAGHTGGTHGKGGDILYRWGKPSNFLPQETVYDTIIRRDDTTITTRKAGRPDDRLDVLHCCTFIPQGCPGEDNIMFFHNNVNAGRSEVIEITPPTDAAGNFICTPGSPFGPEEPAWIYAPVDSFYSPYMSSALRMPNGNTLIHEASPSYNQRGGMMFSNINSRLREVTPANAIVWDYFFELESDASGQQVLTSAYSPPKVMYYPGSYAGITALFEHATAVSGNPGTLSAKRPSIRQLPGRLLFSDVNGAAVDCYTFEGRLVRSYVPSGSSLVVSTDDLTTGMYLFRITETGGHFVSRVVTLLK